MEILQYDFMVRGLAAGLLVAVVAPLIGIFLVLRRYSMVADTLSHVSLAGLAIGLLFGLNPILAALATTVLASLGIEKLRSSKKIYGDSALALFLSGSLALAVVILSLAKGFNGGLMSYLFGSLVTVMPLDFWLLAGLLLAGLVFVAGFYRPLVFISFDEEAAQVHGLPVRFLNSALIILTALTVSLAMPIVGILLISALMVMPVMAAIQLRRGFLQTLFWAEAFSIFSVLTGIFVSFYLDLAPGGTIVLIAFALFFLAYFRRRD